MTHNITYMKSDKLVGNSSWTISNVHMVGYCVRSDSCIISCIHSLFTILDTYTYIYYLLGLFWVPGGAFNIFAIRNAGLAISQGIVASSIVMVRHYTSLYLIYLLIYFSYSFG